MKTLIPLFLVVMLLSCSSVEENSEILKEGLLKSYKVSRDNKGLYSIDYEFKENVALEHVKDQEANINEVHFFSGKVSVAKSKNQLLSLQNNQLQVDFYENGERLKGFSIEDELQALAKEEESYEFLHSYSITDLGNDNYQLDFQVKDNVNVWFDYNEETDAYEVHLEEGVSSDKYFTKSYIKASDVLKIHFVNYYTDGVEAKGVTKRKSSSSKRPRLTIL